MTWSHKILAKAARLDTVSAGQEITLHVDNSIINDGVSHKAVDMLNEEKGLKNKENIKIILDHDIPAGSFDSALIQKKLIDFSKKYDLDFIQSAGTTYEIMLDYYVKKGTIAAVCGGHHGTFGVNGALGFKLTAEEMANLLMDGSMTLKVPECINMVLKGNFPVGVTARDFCLSLISQLGEDAFKGYIVEITGPAVEKLSKIDKISICSLMSRTGAESVIMETEADGDYKRVIDFNLNKAKAVVTLPCDIYSTKTVEEMKGTKISAGFIGACTGGHIDDLRLAASILKGKRIKLGFRLLIGSVSNRVFLQAMDEGLIDIFLDFGAQVTNPGCGSCKTTSIGVVGDGESLITTGSYNFAGCAGTKDSSVYLASVETVARTAISGIIGE
jgi:3-isopropylmalate/(R)-2-methylmalate dehydratase large subunit